MSTEKQQEQVNHPVDETEEIQLNVEPSEMDEEFVESQTTLLDEIDEILEENSQEFVENYIQRGGQ